MRYRPDIDGLRAVAVLGVVVYHGFPQALPGGFVGVDVFFVISGFLITGRILEDIGRGTFTFQDFYSRRVVRIFPALVLVMAASLAAGWLLQTGPEFRHLGAQTAASTVFGANVFFWRASGYFDPGADQNPLLHLWSIGVEEQFYLVWPLLIWSVVRRGGGLLVMISAVLVASFAIDVVLTPLHATAAFFLPISRLWELSAGALLAWRSRNSTAPSIRGDAASLVGLGLVVAAYVGIDRDGFPGWLPLIPAAGTALVIASGAGSWTNRTVLSRRIVVGLGLISYPLYLWHWPALTFARLGMPFSLSATRTVALLCLSVGLAWATWALVERPIRFSPARHGALRIRMLAWGMAAVGACGLLATTAGVTRLDDRLENLSRFQADAIQEYRGGRCLLNQQQVPADFAAECVDSSFMDPARTSVVLWGDSHAAHLYPGLRLFALTHHLALAQFTANDCAPVLLPSEPFCHAENTSVLERISGMHPRIVLLASHWISLDTARLRLTIDSITARTHARIVVLGPVPRWTQPLPRILLYYTTEHPFAAVPHRMTLGLRTEEFTMDAALRNAVEATGAAYVSALDALCGSDGCLTRVHGEPTAWDDAHLTTSGSVVLARAALGSIEPGFRPVQQLTR